MKRFRCAVAASVYLGRSASPFLFRAPYAPAPLLSALGAAGAAPFLVSHDAGLGAAEYVPLMDALVLIGGTYVLPEGACADKGCPARDAFEISLLRAALSAGKPVLAFCGGMQLLNVAFGGTLRQNVPHFQTAPAGETSHVIRTEPGSLLRRLVGETLCVNSLHTQAVDRIGRGLSVSARSGDGVIEGIETEDGLAIGVEWHPEFLWQADEKEKRLFENLAERAEEAMRRALSFRGTMASEENGSGSAKEEDYERPHHFPSAHPAQAHPHAQEGNELE